LHNDSQEPQLSGTAERIINENEIIEASKKDTVCFKPIYEHYHNRIINYVNYKINDLNISADITSNVFFKALTKLNTYKSSSAPFSAWLFKIAFNESMLYFRKTKSRRHVVIDEEFWGNIADELEEDRSEIFIRATVDVLKMLNKSEVELVELKYFERRSMREIAYILNMTEGNAKVRSHRIIKKIRHLKEALWRNLISYSTGHLWI